MVSVCFFTLLIAFSFFGLFSHAINITLLTTPSLLCVQDTVEFNCTFAAGPSYTVTQAGLSINESNPCPSPSQIDSNTLSGVNTTRYTFTSLGVSLSTPSGLYTISPFLLIDSVTRFSCCAPVDMSPIAYTDNISLVLAAPPSAASVNISFTYDSATSCTGTITLTWLAVASDRNVTSYEILQNGTVNGTSGTTTYTTGSLNLLEHYATYTVIATSCAGSSMASSPVMFNALSPGPPSTFLFRPVLTNLSNCVAQLDISLPVITSDRGIAYYLLHINNQLEENETASTNTFNYSIILQLKKYNSNVLNVTITAHSCAGSTSEFATVYGICDSNMGGLSTGEIVGIAVGGVCFIIIAIAVILLCCILIYFAIKRKTRSDQEERKK